MNINKLYSELLDHYFDIEEITFYKIENNIIFIEGYYPLSDIYQLFEFDLNKMRYTEVYNNGYQIYQESLITFIVNRRKYWDYKFYKLTSKLTKYKKEN